MCQQLQVGFGGRVTRLLVTFRGSQLDKPRFYLAAIDTSHVNIVAIINVSYMYTLVFMSFDEKRYYSYNQN